MPSTPDRHDTLLFVTRKFPPVPGGMELLSLATWEAIVAEQPSARLVANRHGNRHLIWWLPVTVVRVAWLLATGKVHAVLAGDGLTLAAVRVAGLLRPRTSWFCIVHGLDLVWGPRWYRRLVVSSVRRCTRVLVNSTATRQAVEDVGIPADRIAVLQLGLAAPSDSPTREVARHELRSTIGVDDTTIVLATVGRLVRRKGVAWFIESVLPLVADVHYVVAGAGPDRANVEQAIARSGTADRVHLLGTVDDERREHVVRGADLFVQPNIRVAGDMEGFGLVVIEAAMRGTFVAASALEGLLDAVQDGVTGELITAEDPAAWADSVRRLTADATSLHERGLAAATAARAHFSDTAFAATLRTALHH